MLNETEKLNTKVLWLEFLLIIIIAGYTFQDINLANVTKERTNNIEERLDTTIVRCNDNFKSYSEVDSVFGEFNNAVVDKFLYSDSIRLVELEEVESRFEKTKKELIHYNKEIAKLIQEVQELKEKN